MKLLTIFALLVNGFVASQMAAAQTETEQYECTLEDDFDDWRISINLEAGEASFFDNDHDSLLTLVGVGQYESMPPQIIYDFEGVDSMNSEVAIGVRFNQTRQTAMLIDNAGTPGVGYYNFICSPAGE